MADRLRPAVLVLNGGSSSGKSSLTRALQLALPGAWLRFSVDTLIDACPPSLLSTEGLDLGPDGSVTIAAAFTAVEQYWMRGLARMAELGAQLLIEDNFVSGPAAQARWRSALTGLPTGWIGVLCDPSTAARRELARGDRTAGMARQQADAVHVGIDYDLTVDSAERGANDLARQVREHWFSRPVP